MARALNPKTIAPPVAPYSHGFEVQRGSKLVFCAGQLGIRQDGSFPLDCTGQAEIAFANIKAVLAEAGLGLEHVVRINAFVSAREHMQPYMAVRNGLFSAPYPASTLMIVSGFTRPEFLVEIEAIAAGPDPRTLT